MTQPLHILMIEDSEDDALLILRELRRGQLNFVSQRVQTADALVSILKTHPWDVIISDYCLPGFDAPSALKIVKETQLDIPFI